MLLVDFCVLVCLVVLFAFTGPPLGFDTPKLDRLQVFVKRYSGNIKDQDKYFAEPIEIQWIIMRRTPKKYKGFIG